VVAKVGQGPPATRGRWRGSASTSSAPAAPRAPVTSGAATGAAAASATGGAAVVDTRVHACLSPERQAARQVTRLGGTVRTLRVQRLGDRHTYDLRGAAVVGYPDGNHYPLLFGKRGPGKGTCVLGGRVVGQQPRTLSWHAMKLGLDGDGLNFNGEGGVIDGLRVDNVEDGIGVTGGDPGGVLVSGAYLTYIRDDCIEDDAIVAVTVQDSLFDGCFGGVSERPGRGAHPAPAPPNERFVLDRVLLRLQPMPYDAAKAHCPANARDGLGSGALFKWSPAANRLVVSDSVLLVERSSVNCAKAMSFPAGGAYRNVTLVWLGGGPYPGELPRRGVTVTRDRHVWEAARATWLSRHRDAPSGDRDGG
jgi:hypothetical protein